MSGLIELRPFLPDDEDIIYEWQSTPGMRRYSRTPSVPSRTEHTAWFAAALKDSVGLNFIILRAGARAGMIRLAPPRESAAADGLEVSLLVAPEHQGCGVASAALRRLIANYAAGKPVLAAVHPDNEASLRLFRSCGFVKLNADWYVYPGN